jgi:hypothetical protein
MKSSFFHIGVNRTMAKLRGLEHPRLNPDGSIPFVPLPKHHDPDFSNLTYGDPWGRLNSFRRGDIAWFIESGTVVGADWGYYLVAYLVVKDVYAKSEGVWDRPVKTAHLERIAENAHEIRKDENYAIILGDKDSSKLLFSNPLRISLRQDPFDSIKTALGLPLAKRATGYWFKRWFQDRSTSNLLRIVRDNATNAL